MSDYWNPSCHGHLSDFLNVKHHVLLGQEIYSAIHNIHRLHNLVELAVVQQHILAA